MIRKLAIVPVLALSLALGGCFATVSQQTAINETFGAVNSAGIALSVAKAYRNLPLCTKANPASVTNVCAKRSVVVKLQVYAQRLVTAMNAAARNPSLIADAQSALSILQSFEAANGVH